MDLLIRRYNNLIDISPDGASPLDPGVIEALRPHLCYEKKIYLQGHDRFTPDGGRVGNIDFEPRQMYSIELGRLTTAHGFLQRIVGVLRPYGVTLRYMDLSPPRERPDCYAVDWARVEQHVTFRHPVQRHGLEQIARNDGGLFVAPPGFGKTFLFEAIGHLFPNAHIHIVVKPVEVAKRIWRQLSGSHPNVGLVGGGGRAEGDRITVYTADSLHLSDGDADILLGDEGHQLAAESYARELGQRYRRSRNYLFTATPRGRFDGTDIRLEMFAGSVIFNMTYAQGVACGLICQIRVRWLPIHLTGNPAAGKTGIPRERWGIWKNEERNRLIAKDVRDNYGPDHQVLVLCAKVEHAINLWREMPEFALCYGEQEPEEVAWYKQHHMLPPGFVEITPARREQLRAGFESRAIKKVIATDVWATGVDFASLQVLYRTDGRQSEIIDGQAPARVSRIYDGKEYGEVVDCCDLFDPNLLQKSVARRRHYDGFGWEQDWPDGRRRRVAHGQT